MMPKSTINAQFSDPYPSQLVDMQCFWYVPTGQLWRVDYQRLEDQPDDAISNTIPQVTAMDGMSNCIADSLYMRASNFGLLLSA